MNQTTLPMIRMRIRSWSGAEWDGVLLRWGGLGMRVAVADHQDAVEFQCRGGQWFAESGDPVQIEMQAVAQEDDNSFAPPPDDSVGVASFCREDPAWLN
jgi:hypothetical protein